MGIIHSTNYSITKKLFNKIFIQKIWKLFIQKNYSFFWKIDYRPGLAPEEYWIRYQILYYIKDYDNGQGIKKGDLPANWKDDNVIVKHHPNNENTEAEKLKSKEVLPAHTNARKDEIRLFPKSS